MTESLSIGNGMYNCVFLFCGSIALMVMRVGARYASSLALCIRLAGFTCLMQVSWLSGLTPP